MGLSDLKNRTKKEFMDFYEHPVQYPINTTKTIVKNYWDIGTSIFTEWGISKYGPIIIQKYNPYIRVANAVITAIPVIGSKERGGRNLCLQAASWAFLTGVPIGKVGAGLLAVSGLYFERKRLKRKKEEQNKSLEEEVN